MFHDLPKSSDASTTTMHQGNHLPRASAVALCDMATQHLQQYIIFITSPRVIQNEHPVLYSAPKREALDYVQTDV